MEEQNVVSGLGMRTGTPEINITSSVWRDIFAAMAAHAMIGDCTGPALSTMSLAKVWKARADFIAETSYLFADLMLAERERDAEERDAKPAA